MTEKYNIPEPNSSDSIEGIYSTGEDIVNNENKIKIRRKENRERDTVLEYVVVNIEDVLSESFPREVFEFLKRRYESENEEYKEVVNNILCSEENSENLKSLVRLIREYAESEQDKDGGLLLLHLPGYYLTIKKIGKKIVILPTHLSHNITGSTSSSLRDDKFISKFDDLQNILKLGFKLPGNKAYVDANAFLTGDKKSNVSYGAPTYAMRDFINTENAIEDITSNDGYAIGFISNDLFNVSKYSGFKIKENGFEVLFHSDIGVGSSKPSEILSVNILFSNRLDDNKREEKIEFYKKEIFDKFRIPIRFFTADDNEGITRIK